MIPCILVANPSAGIEPETTPPSPKIGSSDSNQVGLRRLIGHLLVNPNPRPAKSRRGRSLGFEDFLVGECFKLDQLPKFGRDAQLLQRWDHHFLALDAGQHSITALIESIGLFREDFSC